MSKLLSNSLIATLALGWIGCVDGNNAFRIIDNLSPDANCSISASGSDYVGSPSWDLSVPGDTYVFNVQLSSEVIDRSGPLEANVHDIRVEGWEVELRDVNGDLFALGGGVENPFTVVQGAGFIVPTGLPGAPSFAAAPIVLIPDSYRVPLQALTLPRPIYARFRVFGSTIGGLSTETPWLSYPITLCMGCMVATSCDPDQTVPDGSCLPGQDGDLYCP